MTARETGAVERFFIEHGMIHDRVTGKHVTTEPVEFEEGKWDTSPVDDACALLNQLSRPRPTPSATGEMVERLCDLHKKMLDAVKRQRPYPVSIALGDSDLDTVLDASVAFEQQAATIAELRKALEDARDCLERGCSGLAESVIDATLERTRG